MKLGAVVIVLTIVILKKQAYEFQANKLASLWRNGFLGKIMLSEGYDKRVTAVRAVNYGLVMEDYGLVAFD